MELLPEQEGFPFSSGPPVYLPPESLDLSTLWSYPAAESSEPSPVTIVVETDSDSALNGASSIAGSEQEFVKLVDELNVMVASTIPTSSATSPSSPHSASSSSFEPEYLPTSKGKRGKGAANARNSKKARKNKCAPTATHPNSVELTEEELLTWSSEDYARHLATITEKRRLTDREEHLIKDQKRRIKNRESAHESRERRRVQLEQLQEEVAILKSEKAALAQENSQLREQVEHLQSTVRQYDGLRSIWNGWAASRKGLSSNGVKAAGMCLLVVLFSFGLLFKHHSTVTGPRISLWDRAPAFEAKLLSNNLTPKIISSPATDSSSSSSPSSYSVSARQRNLLWAEELSTKEVPPAAAATTTPTSAPLQQNDDISRRLIAKETDVIMADAPGIVPELAVDNRANLSDAHHRFVNSNVTFLMCTELGKQLPSPLEGQSFKGDPFVIAFLPEDPTRDVTEQSHVIQLTCRLVDVSRAEVRQPQQQQEPTMATPVVLSALPSFS